jgi:uncharacterized protein (TIGR00730 family)
MRKPPPFDPRTLELTESLLDSAGVRSDDFQRQLIGEIIHTALQFGLDEPDSGEVKLMARSFRELRHALKVFRPYKGRKKVSIFGSARTPTDHPDYVCARDFAASMGRRGWMSITGAGPGIMQAGNEGAGPGNSFGLSIRLPWETNGNPFIAKDPKFMVFRYFFTRKLLFAMGADAMAVFPGGYGTLDECFELLTLIQTGKSPLIPMVMIGPEGNEYWKSFRTYLEDHFVRNGWINEEDLFLFQIFSDVESAADYVERFYRNYHSSRFVGDQFVIRMQKSLAPDELDSLNEVHAALCVKGRIEQGMALDGEDEFPELPRLIFQFNRKHYGGLRLLIDQLNRLGID